MRTDAGDGRPSHAYAPYSYTTSIDGGTTWAPLQPMNGTGSARPRLLMLGGGYAPLLMSGGRMRGAGSDDVSLWVEWSGLGPAWSVTTLSPSPSPSSPSRRCSRSLRCEVAASESSSL